MYTDELEYTDHNFEYPADYIYIYTRLKKLKI